MNPSPHSVALLASGPDLQSAVLESVCVHGEKGPTFYNPADKEDRRSLKEFLAHNRIVLFGAVPALVLLARSGFPAAISADPMLQAYALDPSMLLDLQSLAIRYLGEDLFGQFPESQESGVLLHDKGMLPVEQTPRLALAAKTTARLHEKISSVFQPWAAPIYEIELNLVPALVRMEVLGVRASGRVLVAKVKSFSKRARALELKLHRMATNNT